MANTSHIIPYIILSSLLIIIIKTSCPANTNLQQFYKCTYYIYRLYSINSNVKYETIKIINK